MNEIWIYSLLSVFAVSAVSLIGASVLVVKKELIFKILNFLVSFAAGALLGSAFLHLLPEIIEKDGFNPNIAFFIFLGILLFFILEKIIHWRHCHKCYPEPQPFHSHLQPFAYTNLIGDGLHNLIDGMMIASSFLISIPLGITTTLAVIFHEIPQEMGDFGILVKAGFSPLRALLFNLFSGLIAVFGVLFVLIVGLKIESLSVFVASLTIGAFVYIACSDLIPELHKETDFRTSVSQIICAVFGFLIMFGLVLFH